MVNGFSSINLTKLDVLTGFETVKIGTKYILDGKELAHVSWLEVIAMRYSQVVAEIVDACVLEVLR
jgi:adenylosuccinate synthase